MTSKSLKSLLQRIYSRRKESTWTVTLGKKQSGKTNFNLRQMELLHELGLFDGFGSNIKTLETYFDVDFIQDFPTLKERCQMLNPNPAKHGLKRYLFFGSEMGKWLPQDQPWRNTEFIEELQLVRKVGLNWIGDGINRIDKRVINETHFDGIFTKVSITRPDIATYRDFTRGTLITIYGIKPTTLTYDTYESCNFFMEPQSEERAVVLNEDHLIVEKYLDSDCVISKTGLHSQTVKRARDRVLQYYFKHYVYNNPPTVDESIEKATSTAE